MFKERLDSVAILTFIKNADMGEFGGIWLVDVVWGRATEKVVQGLSINLNTSASWQLEQGTLSPCNLSNVYILDESALYSPLMEFI
jgi:hypothetical protein